MNREPSFVRIGRKSVPVIGRRYVNGRELLILEELGSPAHGRRLHAFDPRAGLHGEERRVIIIARNAESAKHLHTLHRVRRHDHAFSRILDLERSREEFVVVMDWVTGPSLCAYLTEVKQGRIPRPSIREAFRLGRDLARNLTKLHRLSFVVHGDLNPENLILNRDTGRLVLIDFGSSWSIENSASRTPGDGVRAVYSAPEMFEDRQPAHEYADQFVATLILYEMLTLVVPFEGFGGAAGWPHHRDEMATSLVLPSALNKQFNQIPQEAGRRIDELVVRGLCFTPSGRFKTSAEWTSALDQIWNDLNQAQADGGLNDLVSRWIGIFADWFKKDCQ